MSYHAPDMTPSAVIAAVRRLLERPAPWVFPLALALALLAVAEPLTSLFDAARDASSFRGRAIGETTVLAIDAAPYSRTYVRIYGLGGAVFLLAACLLAAVARRLGPLGQASERGLFLLGLVASALGTLRLVTNDELTNNLVLLLLFSTIPVLGAGLLGRRENALGAIFRDGALPLAAAGLVMPLTFVFWLVTGREMSIARFGSLGWVLLWTVATVALVAPYAWAVRHRETESLGRTNGRLVLAAAPLMLIPALIPLANELQYRFSSRTPQGMAWILIVLLGAVSLGLFFKGTVFFKGGGLRAAPIIEFFYFPVILGTLALFKVHRHTLYLGALDYFHLGEETVPTQQFFQFGKLPLLDVRLAHTFSDMFYQTLYTGLNGLRGMDMLIWEHWLPKVVAAVIAYLVLARLAGPGLAFLVTALLPVGMNHYYAPAMIVPLCLAMTTQRPSRRRWALLWLALAALYCWRIDFGMATTVALAIVLLPWLLRGTAHRLRAASVSGGIVAASCTVLFLVTTVLSGRPVFGSLGELLRSYTFRLATRTRPEIIPSFDLVAVVQYYLLPVVSLVLLLGLAAMALRGARLYPHRLMLAQIAAFSLIISVRSTERHSLIEGFNPYLFFFLLMASPFLFARDRRGTGPATLAVALTVLISLVVLSPFSQARHRVVEPGLFADGRVFNWQLWQGNEQRVFYATDKHQDLVDYLNESLEEDQTFFDFTNSPLLYLLTNRELPTWLIPNLAQTSETIQANEIRRLDKYLEAGKLPYVVFKQGNVFWDATDGVPNEIRSYRMAEWIYQNYEPLAHIGDYEVWRTPQASAQADSAKADAVVSVYELVPGSPFVQETSVNHNVARVDREDGVLVFNAGGSDPYVSDLFELGAVPWDEAEHWSLDLTFRSSVGGFLQVFWASGRDRFSQEMSRLVPVAPGTWQQHELLLRPPAGTTGMRLANLRMDPPDGSSFELQAVTLRGRNRAFVPLASEGLAQDFSLQRLPYVWGQWDPLQASSATAELNVFEQHRALDQHRVLVPGEMLRVTSTSRDAGYLHVRARTPGLLDKRSPKTVLTARYGKEAPSAFSFEIVPEKASELETVALRPRQDEAIHSMTRQNTPRSIVLSAGDNDPWIHAFMTLEDVPAMPETSDLYLRINYRTLQTGNLQVYRSLDNAHFSADSVSGVEIVAGTAARNVLVDLGRLEKGQRLTDIRLDPPNGALLELFSVEVLRRPVRYDDYLVRLSTQWQWHRWTQGRLGQGEKTVEIDLTASAPVEIESVRIRARD